MLLPRASRLVLAGLIAIANLATPELVCADHGKAHHEAPATPASHHGAGHEHQAPAPHDTGKPDLHGCCPALMSCSASFDPAPVTITTPADHPAVAPFAGLATRLLSRSSPPEPPPPRA